MPVTKHDQESKDIIERVWNVLKDQDKLFHSVDLCPYTETFERVYRRVRRDLPCLTRNEVWTILINLRKTGKCQAPGE